MLRNTSNWYRIIFIALLLASCFFSFLHPVRAIEVVAGTMFNTTTTNTSFIMGENLTWDIIEVHPDFLLLGRNNINNTIYTSPATGTANITINSFTSSLINFTASFESSTNVDFIFSTLTAGIYYTVSNKSHAYTNILVNSTGYASFTFANSETGDQPFTISPTAPTTPTITEPSDTSINPRDSISYTCESDTAGISKWAWTLTKPDSTTVTKTGGAVTSNSQSFSGDDTNLAGTYTVKCEVEDNAGSKISTSKTFTVFFSHAAEAGAGEGAGGAAQIDLSTQEEVAIKEKQGVVTTFTLDGTTVHSITIREVTETTVTLVIESDPITITLMIGETEEADVDSDGVNDISVTLNSIKKGVADITTKRLTPLPKKEMPTEEVPPTEKPAEVTSTEEAASMAWQWILIIVVLVVIGVGYWFIKKKK